MGSDGFTADYRLYCSLTQDTQYKRQSVNCCTHCVSLIQADTLRKTAWPTTREILQVADRDRRSASERQRHTIINICKEHIFSYI